MLCLPYAHDHHGSNKIDSREVQRRLKLVPRVDVPLLSTRVLQSCAQSTLETPAHDNCNSPWTTAKLHWQHKNQLERQQLTRESPILRLKEPEWHGYYVYSVELKTLLWPGFGVLRVGGLMCVVVPDKEQETS